MNPSLIELVAHVVMKARRAGLDHQDQRDAAEAVLMASLPGESSAIAHFVMELAFPKALEGYLAA